MNWMSPIDIKPLPMSITHRQGIFLIGSCFTEHIGKELQELKFRTCMNPNGILFETESVCRSLQGYIEKKVYTEDDLFFFNDLWQSWDHHSRFSNPDKNVCLSQINESQEQANQQLKDADWLIITLGSSYTYRLIEERRWVANCHKYPGTAFEKVLVSIEDQVARLDNLIHRLFHFNNKLKIIFTISPVRHLRDGVVDNNRSKARLIETVHHLVGKFERLYYFPAYELVVDVLRDYRFYDIDLAHPNYAATQFVMEKFSDYAFDKQTLEMNREFKQLAIAGRHRPQHADTSQHQQFRKQFLQKAIAYQKDYPFLDFKQEIELFK
ncbi:MAG: GSCFA domain-containing protein [Bacteroidota bacterium]